MVQSANPNWNRWITASCMVHLTTRLTSLASGVHQHVEGSKRETENVPEWFELRCDGPMIDEHSNGNFRFDVELNILCTHVISTDAYRCKQLMGYAQAAMDYSIEVKKYGDGVDDDESVLGWLTHNPSKKSKIRSDFFGQVRPDVPLQQGTVEGHYRMFLYP